MRDKETITIPLNKVSYEDLEALTIEQQTQLFVKDKEIERLNNIINELEEHIVRKLKEFNNPEEYYTLKQIVNIHYRLQELKENK